MTEAKIQKDIMKYLKTVPGSFFLKVAQGKYSLTGISDIIGLWNGTFVAIEVKAGTNTMTPLQAHFQELVKKCGGIAICVYSVEEVKGRLAA